MRVLVTGGAGFVGSHHVRALLAGGLPGTGRVEVTVSDTLTYAGNLADLAEVAHDPRFRFVRGDTVRWFRDNRSWWEPLVHRDDPLHR